MNQADDTAAPATSGSLWKHPDFLKLWFGQTVSDIGSHISRDGLPLLAVLTLGASSTQMGVISALGSLPVLIMSLPAGVWVDRLRRRPLLIAADLARALLLLTIPLAGFAGMLRIEHLYAVVLLVGALTVMFNIAYVAHLPTLIPRRQLMEGNSKLAFTNSLSEILGSGLAGVLVQIFTAPIAILIDSASFVISAFALGSLRKPEPPPASGDERQAAVTEIGEGIRAVIRHPLLFSLASAEGVLSLFGNLIGPLYALYAIRELGLNPAALGLTIATGGVGSVLGSLFAGPAVRRFGLGRTMVGSIWLGAFFTLLIPLARGGALTAMLILLVAQLFGDCLRTIYFINSVSLRQSVTPDHLLGRVNASIELLVEGIGPLSALAGGLLGDLIGLRTTLAIAAAGGFIAGAILFASRVRGLKQHPAQIEEELSS